MTEPPNLSIYKRFDKDIVREPRGNKHSLLGIPNDIISKKK